jgi:diketogulonate reductase-like aldo/keto reductase
MIPGGTVMKKLSYLMLHNQVHVPSIGFDLSAVPEAQVQELTAASLRSGQRHLCFPLESACESALAAGIEEAGINPEDLFLTGILKPSRDSRDAAIRDLNRSMKRLNVTHINLLLLHLPADGTIPTGAWQAAEDCYKQGRAAAIGIDQPASCEAIEQLLQQAEIAPMISRIAICPGLMQEALCSCAEEHRIAIAACLPDDWQQLLETPAVRTLAGKYDVLPEVILYEYLHHRPCAILWPKPIMPEAGSLLSDDEMKVLDCLRRPLSSTDH